MGLLGHGEQFIMTQLHIAEPNKDAVSHGAAPQLRFCQRTETQLIQYGFMSSSSRLPDTKSTCRM